MQVAFLYNRAAEDPAHISEDEDPARSPVVAAIERLGHSVTPIACTLDLSAVRRQLLRTKPDVAFNRVESLGGSDAMMGAITLLLDAIQIPYTGCSSVALTATASKVFVKERLVRAGLPTPRWVEQGVPRPFSQLLAPCSPLDNPKSEIRNPKFILKSDCEHASFQMDDESIVGATSAEQLQELLRNREARTGRPHFAEEFIDGREFNLSLIGPKPEVLRPAEIDFSAFPPGMPRIVGHVAKWKNNSFEYQSTIARFDFPESDQPLLRELCDLARECWRLFDLTGYARVDFRVDHVAQPWILEVNTNPCITPESGFSTALEVAGIGYDGGIQRILEDAISRSTMASRRVHPGGDKPRRSPSLTT